MISLDARLRYICDCVRGDRLADIGCDHGKVCALALLENRVSRALACDISAASLEKARELCRKCGLEDRMSFRVTDGFEGFEADDADVAVIAGMGGLEIVKILGFVPIALQELILSPHAHAYEVRKKLGEIGFGIVSERMIKCARQYYPVICARRGSPTICRSEDDLRLGSIQPHNEDYRAFLIATQSKYRDLAEKVERVDTKLSAHYEAIAQSARKREELCRKFL